MDLDSTQLRLNQVLIALNNSKETHKQLKSKRRIYPYKAKDNFEMEIIFGEKEQDEAVYHLYSIIQCLGNVKDIIKVSLVRKGLNSRIIEDRIDESKYLKILMDLNNEHKHGFPLKNGYRSSGKPIIVEIQQGLSIPPGKTVEIIAHYDTGQVELDKACTISITAKVVDRNGDYYFTLDELIENSISE
jgi:hypothetical protein